MRLTTKGHSPLVQALRSPDAYPEKVAQVRMAETHVSYLFFTHEHVYKVKKPVDYGFLDFTTLDKRHHYCLQEVALNSRISPDVYEGVVPIRVQGGSYTIEGPGETVEYAVKMRRLPQERALSELLSRSQVSEGEARRVAAKIADFHRRAPTDSGITALGDLNVVRQNAEENFEQTERYVGVSLSQDEFDDLVAYSRAFMEVKEDVFHRRASEGRIRDGHGDLHSANVFLEDGIHIIDCIEFNDRFRCLDVAEDIAFLAMDFDFYQRPDLSEAFVSEYVEASGDAGMLVLLDFFKAYRAYVRGKVTSFRLDDPGLPEDERQETQTTAQAYFRLAHSYVTKARARPALILVSGLMGAGKTFISEEIARRWNMEHISSDVTRKALANIRPTEHRYEAYGQGIYSPEFSRLTYDTIFRQARERLAGGESVVLDATFSRREGRKRALDIANETRAHLWIVECVASEDETKRRLVQRAEGGEETASDGRWELFREQQENWEPMNDVPGRNYIRLETTGPREENIRHLLQLLYARVLSTTYYTASA